MKKIRKHGLGSWAKWLILALLVVVVGCQSIGGLDINRALLSGMDTTSMQQSVSISLNLKTDPAKTLTKGAKEMVELMNNAKLELRNIKMESWERMSINGQLTLAEGAIPFQAFMSSEHLVLKVDGISRSIVVPLKELGAADDFTMLIEKLQEEYRAKGIDKSMASLIVANLPNPKSIKVTSGTETIRNENVSVYKLETSLDGTELVPLVKSFIRNLTKDDANFKKFIGELYDVLWPALKPYLKKDDMPSDMLPRQTIGSPLGNSLDDLKESLLEAASDKELAVDMIHTTAKQLLYIGLISIDSVTKSDDPAVKLMLGEQTQVKARLAFDQSLKLRKSEIEVSIPSPDGGKDGITAVQLNVQSESWDINKPVKADSLDIGKTPFITGTGRSASELIDGVDPESLLGKLIASQAKLYEPEVIYIPVEESDKLDPYGAYIRDGVSYMNVGSLAAYMGADVTYEGDSVTVTGPWGTVIKLTVGSADANVDGELYEMDGVVIEQDELVYVPLRFIAEQLYGEVEYDAEEGLIELVLPGDLIVPEIVD